MHGYYADKLSARRLRACYDLAPAAVRAYLNAETDFVLARTSSSSRVLELGCGYGRVLERLATSARVAVGIDTSIPSLRLARGLAVPGRALLLATLDASRMGFRDGAFDLTVCVQNGISAFAVDRFALLSEAVRVTRAGGTVLFSSYSPRFWQARLEWFELQAARGLVGPIDYAATGDGVIACTDGFRATTVGADEFMALAARLDITPRIREVEGSSLFCELVVP